MSTLIVTSEFDLNQVVAPNLPLATEDYSRAYQDQLNNVLRLYFNRLDAILGQLVATTSSLPITFPPTSLDAFGRLQVAEPYTLFDSQNRYAADNQFDTSTATGGTATYNSNLASISLAVTTTSGSSVVRQSYRVMPYQPGKSLEAMMTFTMNAGKTGLRQRVGYFNTQNGVFLQYDGTTLSFVLRSNSIPTPGTPSDARTVNQADWNGDKLDGTGASGITLDVTKTQILYFDFEWLGVGQVRCGFFQDGQFIVCHTFDNENVQSYVYMTTAILPIRYEITNTATTASSSTMQQICSTIISNGGYQQASIDHTARRVNATSASTITTSFYPIASIRLASTALGAVVIPSAYNFLPTTADNYEIALIKNTTLTSPSWTAVSSDANVEYDISATAMTGGTICANTFTTGKSGPVPLISSGVYNWDLQLGSSLAGVSDIFTLAARVVTTGGAGSGGGIGSISFYDLTQ
jgi:hypothetical protein